ncbi:hypothetical protein D3C77_552660 [compost metagenome]
MLDCRRHMDNHALDEVLGGFVPVGVFLICRLHDNRLGNQRGILQEARAARYENAQRIEGCPVRERLFAGNPEGVDDVDFLSQGCTLVGSDAGKFPLGIGCQDAAGIEEQVADKAD